MNVSIGAKLTMSKDALDNYGESYQGMVLTVISKANKYMPAKQFYKQGQPKGYHPGYDDAIPGMWLYDFAEIDFSLYEWELNHI